MIRQSWKKKKKQFTETRNFKFSVLKVQLSWDLNEEKKNLAVVRQKFNEAFPPSFIHGHAFFFHLVGLSFLSIKN